MDQAAIALKNLCCHTTGLREDKIQGLYQFSVGILNNGPSTPSLDSSINISDKIKKFLVDENRIADAIKISSLLQKIEKSKVLKNKSHILYLLLCLHDQHWLNSRVGVFNLYNGNGFQSASAAFSSKEGSIHSSSSHNNIQNIYCTNTREGKVARLAALYKGADTKKQKDSITNNIVPKPNKRPDIVSSSKRLKEPQTDVTDDILIREILFAFQGIEGKFIKYDTAEDTYKVDAKIRISLGNKDLIGKLTEVGWMYSKIKQFCESHPRINDSSSISLETVQLRQISGGGLVNQSLILALREELNEYCRLIAVLESQMQDYRESSGSSDDSSISLTFKRLLLWTLEPRNRLRSLCHLIHAARGNKGGALLSQLYKHLHHGDPGHVAVVQHALSQSCKPIFVMLTDWILDGSLQDSHQEFFIASDPTVPDDRLWHDRYDIRWCMLPSFISKSQALKVLATGKSLNFLKTVCSFKGLMNSRDSIKASLQKTTVESLFMQDECNKLEDLISLTFRTASANVLEEIVTQHKLVNHLTALRRYLLLGQGDFIHYLMEILELELCKPANKLQPHNLSSLLENAISASNAQYEEVEILQRLNVKLLQSSPGETGWDVFSLNYEVDGPIGTVFSSDCMQQYLMMFNSLWRAKHMERILSATWKQQSATSKMCRSIPELRGSLHKIQLLLTEMVHLVQQMAYYMTFEVLECSWHALMNRLKCAQSLDDVINAHNSFLQRIIAGALLDSSSKDIRTHLRTLYDLMVQLESLQGRVYSAVINELTARKAYQCRIEERSAAGQFGCSQADVDQENERKQNFITKFVPSLRTDLKILIQSYQDMVQGFLLILSQHEDENLHLLSSRLDFNEYYNKKDSRINMRLTYLHKRMSLSVSFCQ